jgi:CRP-like cAMP-binding protein
MGVNVTRLKASDLFEVLEFSELQDIAALAYEKLFEAGQIIFKPGQRADEIYIVEEGRVSIEVEVGPSERISVYVLGAGEFFGYPALLPSKAYTTYCVCLEKTKLIAIPGDKLLSLLEKDPSRGYKVMKKLAELIAKKLAETRRQLVFCVLPPSRA